MAFLVNLMSLPITYVKFGLCIFLSYLWFCKVDTLSYILWKFHECSHCTGFFICLPASFIKRPWKDHSCEVSSKSHCWFVRRRWFWANEQTMHGRQRMAAHRISSSGIWPVELKINGLKIIKIFRVGCSFVKFSVEVLYLSLRLAQHTLLLYK